jgi:N-ethylmaleimide reductase
MYKALFKPLTLGQIELQNRIVMAPMTRNRARPDGVPAAISSKYYALRASAGMIITEAVQISEQGKGYARTPGIHSSTQVAAWEQLVQTVRSNGGTLVMQLFHCGRISSHHNKAPGVDTVAPSAIRAQGQIYSDGAGMVAFDSPRALRTDEVPTVIEEYRQATENALAVGCAGVELHATSGYLPAQFLSTGTNRRNDRYGGSVRNRIRFVVETLEAMASVSGADRVGIRICPGNPFNDLTDEDPGSTFAQLLQAIDPMGLAYLHVIRLASGPLDNLALVHRHFSGPIIYNDGYGAAEANEVVRSGRAVAVSFARHFIANPNLVSKIRSGEVLAGFNRKTLYTPGPRGYTDYQ